MKLVIFEVLDWKLEVHINLAVFSDSNNIGKLDDQPENNTKIFFFLIPFHSEFKFCRNFVSLAKPQKVPRI